MPQLKEKPDEQQKYRELEGLGDFDRRTEGKQIVFEADEAISKSNDPVEIISIFESARAKIFELYKGSRFFQRDVDRFEKFLAIITIVMSIPTIIFSAYGMNLKGAGMPFAGSQHGFAIVVAISAIISLMVAFLFRKLKLFK